MLNELKIKLLHLKKSLKPFHYLLLLISLAICFLGAYLNTPQKEITENQISENQPPLSLETQIPDGQILIPIELINANSISALIGPFTKIDLYNVTIEGQKGKKIGSYLKLIRSPTQENIFGVLASDEEADKLLKESGPYMAVIRNPKEKPSKDQLKKNNKVQKPIFFVEYGND
jgi:hypothetical protein